MRQAVILRSILTAVAAVALLVRAASGEGEPPRTTVGMAGRFDQLVLPGSELAAKPLEDARSPVVLRIVASYRHGSDFRYDLEYYGLEPGSFDLKDYLVRKDGSSSAGLPSIMVEVVPVLAPGQIEPNRLLPAASPSLGGYRAWLATGAVVWTMGLVTILFARRRRRLAAAEGGPKSVSLADRLRPLVDEAAAGRLSQSGLAELERLLLAYWRRRLDLDQASPSQAIAALRRHPEAGELLRQLEEWLHRPGAAKDVDVTTLLRPYQNITESSLAEGQRLHA